MGLKADLAMFTAVERKNIMIYMLGIFMYKFGLEAFNGSISTLAQDRFKSSNTFTKWGILSGLNQAMQCVGSILIAPLIKKYPTRAVLATSILIFGAISAILLFIDAATGGRPKSNGKVNYGSYHPDVLFPVYSATGIVYGMVELIRRVIPRDIVGGHVGKLKRMDALVHVLYEVAGTSGAFASAALITKLGNNYAFAITPLCFTACGIAWNRIDTLGFTPEQNIESRETNYLTQLLHGVKHFGQAVSTGAYIVCSKRKFIWLIPGYSMALYGHRYIEQGVVPIFAKRVLGVSTYSQIIVGGSNFGELLGALMVFFTANVVQTPIPFIRLDALTLNILWILPFIRTQQHNAADAWKVAACFIPLSLGWAAGDVSLAAYIQSSLAAVESQTSGVSALGAVMAFLYVIYIVMNAALSTVLGAYVDRHWNRTGDVLVPIRNVGSIQATVLCVIILAATLIPKGALSFNPKLLNNERLDEELVVPSMGTSGEDMIVVELDEKTTQGSVDYGECKKAKRQSAEVEMFVTH